VRACRSRSLLAPRTVCCDAAGVGRRSVTLRSDYRCGWPLWLEGGGVVGDWFADEGDLSPQLRRDLVAVQEFFDERFHWDGGWRDPGDDARYADRMVDALLRLGRELGDEWVVTLDLWPVTDEAVLLPCAGKASFLHREGVDGAAARRPARPVRTARPAAHLREPALCAAVVWVACRS